MSAFGVQPQQKTRAAPPRKPAVALRRRLESLFSSSSSSCHSSAFSPEAHYFFFTTMSASTLCLQPRPQRCMCGPAPQRNLCRDHVPGRSGSVPTCRRGSVNYHPALIKAPHSCTEVLYAPSFGLPAGARACLPAVDQCLYRSRPHKSIPRRLGPSAAGGRSGEMFERR
jgi:hypothetical protein